METAEDTVNTEAARIRAAYARRDRTIPESRYSYFNPAHLYWMQQRERDFLRTLRRVGGMDLREKRILEIGCGDGKVLRHFLTYGAKPEHLTGIDLLPDRVERAQRLAPHIKFRCVDATALPFVEASFDLVCQITVFTSILDPIMRRRVAGEMMRILKPSGLVFWYDFLMDNPSNPDVRGVKKEEIHSLFPGCSIDLRRVTLAPPLTRLLAPYSWLACYVLEKIPLLCTHYVGVIKKRALVPFDVIR